MKKMICLATAALLAIPVQARALDWEVKVVTHTVTAKVGENSFTLDGEEIPLPEGTEVYKKDGYVMLPAEPLLKLTGGGEKPTWYWEESGLSTALAGEGLFTFDTKKNELFRNGSKIELSGALEVRGKELFLPLRGWKSTLELDGYKTRTIAWDSAAQTATLQFSGEELLIEEMPERTPEGTGAEPEYILEPTRKYERISNLGDGYFSAIIGSVSEQRDILDNTGKVIQSYGSRFDVEYLGENRFLVREYDINKEEGREKVVDENGKIAFPLEGFYLKGFYMEPFSEGLAIAWTMEGKKFVDVDGNTAFPEIYMEAEPFSEGLAAVCPQTLASGEPNLAEYWGYIDKSGRLVVPAKYEKCTPFREGLAAVRSGGKWGYIDQTGREVIPPQYGWASYFYDGTAFVQEKNPDRTLSAWVIDKTGRQQGQKFTVKGSGLYYIYSDHPELYSGVMRSEDVVEYARGHSHLFTYYDAGGEIPNEKLEWVFQSADGLMAYEDKETGKFGYVDEAYNWVVAPVLDHAEDFQDGYAVVYRETKQGDATIDSEWGIIKKP